MLLLFFTLFFRPNEKYLEYLKYLKHLKYFLAWTSFFVAKIRTWKVFFSRWLKGVNKKYFLFPLFLLFVHALFPEDPV